MTEASQHEELRVTTNRLGYTIHPRGTNSQEHNAPKNNKLFKLHLHVSPWRTPTYAPNAKGKTTQSGQVLHSQIPPKATNTGEGYERKDKGGERKRNSKIKIQKCSPRKEGWIGRILDLDLNSRFPQIDVRIMGGMERKQAPRGK